MKNDLQRVHYDEQSIALSIIKRTFMQDLRDAANEMCAGNLNPDWVRAYEALADAADRLDAMQARCELPPSDGWKTDDPQNVSAECICKGNWQEIVKTCSPLIGGHYRDKSGVEYVFYGLVHGDDDYYYGMSSDEGPNMLLSCVGSIEGHGFMMIRDA